MLTLHGSQFRNAACIVASPPCQEFSYAAQPWKRAKAEVPEVLPAWWDKPEPKMNTGEMAEWQLWKARHPAKPPDTSLFDACFRIQREACEAAGHHIPLVVENVKGAQRWVGPARWHYGSFYLWGDVPPLMPFTGHRKVPGMNFHEHEKTGKPGRSFQTEAVKVSGLANGRFPGGGLAQGFIDRATKNGGDWFSSGANCSLQRRANSGSKARKAASAQIAKIPLQLARWIARVYEPEHCMEATA